MTENKTPDLPHVLATTESTMGPYTLEVRAIEERGLCIQYRSPIGLHQHKVPFDPEALLRSLAQHTPHLRIVDAVEYADALAGLAAAGLAVGSAGSGEPVAWKGVTGEVFREFAQDDGRMFGTGAERAMTRAEVEQYHGPLTPLYAGRAPEGEPVRPVYGDLVRDRDEIKQHCANRTAERDEARAEVQRPREKVAFLDNALRSAPEGEPVAYEDAGGAIWRPRAAEAHGTQPLTPLVRQTRPESETVRELEAEVQRLTSALGAANHNYANMRDGRLNDTLAEVANLRDALEKAEVALADVSEAYTAQGRALTSAAEHEALRLKAVRSRQEALAARQALTEGATSREGE